ADRLTTPWQVSDGPLVQAVDRLRPSVADGARRSRRGSLERGDDLVRADRHVVEPEAIVSRKQVGSEVTSAWHRSQSYWPPPGSSPKVGESHYSRSLTADFLHDDLYGIRDGVVEHVWPIVGRGKLR